MENTLVITCHPDPKSFTRALAAAYLEGARASGAPVEHIELHDLAFDPVLRDTHSHAGSPGIEPDLLSARAAIARARHVTLFFPTWWSAPPALLKGFIDRAFVPGFAFSYQEGKLLPVKLLGGRSARIVTTMDSPRLWYRLVYRRALHRAMGTGTLAFSGFRPVAETTFYGLRESTDSEREQALARVRREAGEDVRRAARAAARIKGGVGKAATSAA